MLCIKCNVVAQSWRNPTALTLFHNEITISHSQNRFVNVSGSFLHKVQRFSWFTCSKIAAHFTGSFQAALFSFADLRRNKSFLLAESFFSPSVSKKNEPLEKNRFFGTCKPANYLQQLQSRVVVLL